MAISEWNKTQDMQMSYCNKEDDIWLLTETTAVMEIAPTVTKNLQTELISKNNRNPSLWGSENMD